MAPASNDDQFKFLISCIRYSNNGKVDFEEVRKECDICSRGAAAKRYERMMKAHGIYQSTSSIRDTPIASPKRKTSPATATTGASFKKRKSDKASQFTMTSTSVDDDESLTPIKAEPARTPVKDECVKESIKVEKIKDEDDKEAKFKEENIKEEEKPMLQRSPLSCISSGGRPISNTTITDHALLNDFISFGGRRGSAQASASASDTIPTSNDPRCMPDSILITD
ncbi:hypothetical protein P7C71_g5265, partial [Lecanoromycetidae sp. Uapishka_2]